MEENDINNLEKEKPEAANKILKNFIDKNNQVFTFADLSLNNKRRRLWTSLFKLLENVNDCTCHKNALACVRILSRDKTDLNELVCDKFLATILHHAGLVSQEEALTQINHPAVDYAVVLEALKCLCNLIFNSPTAQKISSQNHSVEGVVMRLRTYRERELPQEIKFFDMKLLFLVTALSSEVRPRLKEQLHGLTYLMETLDLILKEAGGEERGGDVRVTLSDDQVSLASEVLKVLFNLTVRNAATVASDEEEDAHLLRLVSILHDLLLCSTECADKQLELRIHTVNLLMCIPASCYVELTTPLQLQSVGRPLDKALEHDGRSMEALAVLLEFLDNRLDNNQKCVRSQVERLSPALTVLLGCSRNHRAHRKWLRAAVLPPMTCEMHRRPEEGNSTRNKLCRLLTSPVTPVRDLAADFLFVLCKENVVRMVKYTGYGNAAGLLANRGLMLGGPQSVSAGFSSDSEDSDTEEYKRFRNQVNPVTGRVEPPRQDPVACMSDEQKEYEAMKLVNMMDRLARDGIVQPCRIGEDGRPEPVDHILQMLDTPATHNRPD